MIHCEKLSKSYPTPRGAVRSLDNLDLRIDSGQFVIVRGPSGCGKTTLLMILGAMLRPSSGRVEFEGRDLYAMSRRDRAAFRANNIGFIFQMFHLVPYLTILENVLMASSKTDTQSERIERARLLLKELGLHERTHHVPNELSAGERQRTAIARALLNQPRLVLADEPTGNLDPQNAAEVFRHLSAFHRSGGTVIVVTHGSMGDEFADRHIELRDGFLHSDGK